MAALGGNLQQVLIQCSTMIIVTAPEAVRGEA